MKILIGIDDVHPQDGWGKLKDLKYPIELNKKYGAKFILFTPTCYHCIYPLSDHKDWFESVNKLDFIEWGAHGHFHNTVTRDDECEFAELDELKAESRINAVLSEWDSVQIKPRVWKNPGWLCTQESANEISKNFDIVHAHGVHDQDIHWKTTTIAGHVGIDKKEIHIDGGIVIFQSHINGPNDNNWDEENYLNMCKILDEMKEKESLEFTTFGELYDSVKAEPVEQ